MSQPNMINSSPISLQYHSLVILQIGINHASKPSVILPLNLPTIVQIISLLFYLLIVQYIEVFINSELFFDNYFLHLTLHWGNYLQISVPFYWVVGMIRIVDFCTYICFVLYQVFIGSASRSILVGVHISFFPMPL